MKTIINPIRYLLVPFVFSLLIYSNVTLAKEENSYQHPADKQPNIVLFPRLMIWAGKIPLLPSMSKKHRLISISEHPNMEALAAKGVKLLKLILMRFARPVVCH